MELSGNDANRWEQMSNKIQELEQEIVSYANLANDISVALKELSTNLKEAQGVASSLSNLAYKEVLRQESGTLNATDGDYDLATGSFSLESEASSQPMPQRTQIKDIKQRKSNTKSKSIRHKQTKLIKDEDE